MNDIAPIRSRHRSWHNDQLLPFGRDTVHGLYGVIHISPLRGDLSQSPKFFLAHLGKRSETGSGVGNMGLVDCNARGLSVVYGGVNCCS